MTVVVTVFAVVGSVQAPKHKGLSRIYFHIYWFLILFARGDEQGNAPGSLSFLSYAQAVQAGLIDDVYSCVNPRIE